MDEILQQINGIEGVAGVFVSAADGKLLGHHPRGLFHQDSLQSAARIVAETTAALENLPGARSGDVELVFDNARLFVQSMEGGELSILCVPEINLPLLRLRAALACRALQAELQGSRAAPAEEPLLDRLKRLVEEELGDKAEKPLAMLAAAGQSPRELGAVCTQIERFTKLFVGRHEADALGAKLRRVLEAKGS